MLNQAKLELEKYNTDRTEVELAEAELARWQMKSMSGYMEELEK